MYKANFVNAHAVVEDVVELLIVEVEVVVLVVLDIVVLVDVLVVRVVVVVLVAVVVDAHCSGGSIVMIPSDPHVHWLAPPFQP